MSTPMTAAPRTISVGDSWPYSIVGRVDLVDRDRAAPLSTGCGRLCAHLAASTSGLGSFFCTSDIVCSTAGLTMSVSGFG